MKPSVASALLLAAASASVEIAAAIGSPFQINEWFCGQWDIRANDKLILYNNHWGGDNDKAGYQCTTVTKLDAATGAISYETAPHWAGSAGQVKSFTNVETVLQPVRAYDIASIQAKWKIQATDSLDFDSRPVYNAAFDLFFGPTNDPNATPEYEVMVWTLARNGAWPLEQFGRFDVTIDGRVWTLHSGTNGPQRVLSFTTAESLTNLNLNLKGIVDAAVKYMMPKDYYLTKLQGGFEYFHGASRLMVSDYLVNVQKVATTVVPRLGQCNVAGAQCADKTFCMSWDPSYAQCIDTPAKCSVQWVDTDIVGADIKNIRDILPAQCCDACASTPGCTAYAFVNYNKDNHAVCYLKSATLSTPRKAAKGIVSAMVDGGTQAPTPPPTTAAPVPKMGQCNIAGAKCMENTFCMPWDPSYSQCIETPAKCPVQLLDTDIVGADIKNIRDILPAQCCDACATTAGCTSYTFVNYNADGHAVCYLKSATQSTERKTSKGLISAFVTVAPTPPPTTTAPPTTAPPTTAPPTTAPPTTAPPTTAPPTTAPPTTAPPTRAPIGSPFQINEKFCGQWDVRSNQKIILYNNHWGFDDDKNGTQCTTVTKIDATTGAISYDTSAKWAGTPWQVKSFTNVETIFDPLRANEIASVPAKWKITPTDELEYDSAPLYNAAFDLFFGPTNDPNAKPEYEIMVWVLARNGAGPLEQFGRTDLYIDGRQWTLHNGTNYAQNVLSFTTTEDTTDVSLDLQGFIDEAVKFMMPKEYYLTKLQGGFEYFHGQSVLSVSDFVVDVKKGEPPVRTQPPTSAPTPPPSPTRAPIGSPFKVNEKFCGQWDIRSNQNIILYNNHWKAEDDKNGTQCTTVTKIDATTGAISYETNPKWAGTPWQVKSFTNVETRFDPLRTDEIASIPAKWKITPTDVLEYDSAPLYNAAFDLFFGPTNDPNAKPEYEIMVWVLARNGAGPLEQFGRTDLVINSRPWTLHNGTNYAQNVLSFTTTEDTTDVSLDLQGFIDAAVKFMMPKEYYLTKLQGGFEYFHGQSVLSVSDFLVNVNQVATQPPATTQPPTTTQPPATTQPPVTTQPPSPLVPKNGQCNIAGAKCVENTFCMPWDPNYSQCIETPAKCPVQLLDTDIVGADIKTIRDILPAQCCDACASTAGCTSYTFVNYNADGHAVCYLKSATQATARKASKGLVSAFVAATIVKKMGQCNLPNVQCEDKTFCMSWDPSYSQCIETPAKCPVQLLDTDIVGADIKNIRDISPAQCCDACATTAGCTSYTFVNYNADGHAVCYLKSATASTARKTSKGLISAFIQA